MKSFNNPPSDIKNVWAIILSIYGLKANKNTWQGECWVKAKTFMANPQKAVDNLKAYDFDKIDEKFLKNVKSMIKYVGLENIQPEQLKAKSEAVAQMGSWIMNWVEAAEANIEARGLDGQIADMNKMFDEENKL